ncbi:MAG: CPBP family intramembrane metalloprotease [Bacteroidia bacterium]|nr:CPBP family intramembrane metalloprotease [Bacteroidia bacterium]
MNLLAGFKELFTQAHAAGKEAEIKEGDTEGKRRAGREVAIVSITAMICLILIRYFGDDFYFYEIARLLGFDDQLPLTTSGTSSYELIRLGWWIFVVVICYLIVPMAVIRWLLKKKVRDFGLRGKGVIKDAWLYVLLLTVMIPLVLLVGKGSGFQAKYPFYQVAGEGLSTGFWIWEAMYFFQFFTLEFFFRGFLLHGSKARFGYYAIFFMCIPYCMIHFQKPVAETLGSVLAGITLGALSLKSNSIWMGTLLHYSVAILMDMAALYYKGLL